MDQLLVQTIVGPKVLRDNTLLVNTRERGGRSSRKSGPSLVEASARSNLVSELLACPAAPSLVTPAAESSPPQPRSSSWTTGALPSETAA